MDPLLERNQRTIFRRRLKPILANFLRHPSHSRWHARFFFGIRSDEWYARCFSPAAGQVTGDITPAYARLRDERVSHAARLLPDARIIYVLRNPIERIWSQASMYFGRFGRGGLANASSADVHQFLDRDLSRANNAYVETIARWQRHFGSDRVHIAFFDQLQEDPHEFLVDICNAIGVPPHLSGSQIHRKVHAGEKVAMQPQIKQRLAAEYHAQLEELHRLLGNRYTAMWLASAWEPSG